MLELVPENIDEVVVLNVISRCGPNCSSCSDFTVGIHNWMLMNNFRYLILDLQDEKDVCSAFLEETLQLMKRLRCPFLFAGVMDKPRQVLESYNYSREFELFATPEEAVRALKQAYPEQASVPLTNVIFGQAIAVASPRSGLKNLGEDGADSEGADSEESDTEPEAEGDE